MNKLQRNKDATFHKLTEEDSIQLLKIYKELQSTISVIIERDSLPNDPWFPSQDFEYLIRQKEE